MLVQVRFGFTKMKRFIRVYGSGSGSVRHPDSNSSSSTSNAIMSYNTVTCRTYYGIEYFSGKPDFRNKNYTEECDTSVRKLCNRCSLLAIDLALK